ncbi:hypothetical protein SRB17_04080 [Streptomyces sp. RB17]|nr:hypothetical protein [Streptomyces sp. RB17]
MVKVPDRRLLWKLWTATMADFLPLMITLSMLDAADDGLSWSAVADVSLEPAICAFICFPVALYLYGALVRRARGTGIPLTAEVLAATQRHTFPPDRAARLRADLCTSERAWDVLNGEELHFRWRPFRGRRSVRGTVTFDDSSGEAHMEIHTDGNLTSGSGLRRTSAFVALCQIARLVSR